MKTSQLEIVAESQVDFPKPLDLFADAERCANVAVLECRDNLDFLRGQPGEKFKLVVTSPP
ncbi:MAG: hypothetical protein OXF90_05925, partial [Chloroflexi bacterium]|nr:hypothetical protein [Chloroflexota bacterium]